MRITVEVTMSQEYIEGHQKPFMGEGVTRKFFIDTDLKWYDGVVHLWNGLTKMRSDDVLHVLIALAKESVPDGR